MKKMLCAVLLLCCFACEKEELDNRIIGRWVDEQSKKDTLIFESRGNLLKIKTLDKQHLDFVYNIKGDSISFNWMYSSDIKRYNYYYFKVVNNKLSIQNFYIDSMESNALLKFDKIQF